MVRKQYLIYWDLTPIPCGAKRQVIGVYDKNLLKTFSTVAKNLDMEHVLVVHGDDGLDEISISWPTQISELKNYKIENYSISPQDFGLSTSGLDEIAAQSPEDSLKTCSGKHFQESNLQFKT